MESRVTMSRLQTVASDRAPQAIGPYSQAVMVDGWVYCSGQIALDPATGQVVVGDVAAQTDRALINMAAVLHAAGASLATVVKTTVFLSDMGDFTAMNEVYAKHFGDHRPARSTIAAAGLPRSVRVEIDCVARNR
jgi:2-iminobutanoate/2-iminopropanoate deaminase